MKNDPHMLTAAREGYEGAANPHYRSSSLWMAHQVGAELALRKMRAPAACSMSTGYRVNIKTVSGAQFVVAFADELMDLTFKPKAA